MGGGSGGRKRPWWASKTCRLMGMLSLTLSFFFVELIFGALSKSMALVADSFHMLSDVLALVIAFACMKISRRKSSANTFGWVRAEVLGALVNAVFLLALCFSIFVEAIKRLCEPHEVEEPLNVLIVGIVGLVVNIIGIFMFHGHASVSGHSHARPVALDLSEEDEETERQIRHVSKEAHNIAVLEGVDEEDESGKGAGAEAPLFRETTPRVVIQPAQGPNPAKAAGHGHSHDASQLNMHGVFLHVLGDAFGSVIVIINALIVWQVEAVWARLYLDPSLSLIMVLIISCTTVPLLKESASILLQAIPAHLDLDALKNKLLKIDGILAVHDFHVWRLAGNKIIATAHIQCRNLDDYMRLANMVKEFFHDQGIHSTTIQPEFTAQATVNTTANGNNCAIVCDAACAAEVLCCAANGPESVTDKE